MTVKAIYENGLFRPLRPVNLPENVEVEINLPAEEEELARDEEERREIVEILSREHDTGQADLAERHNEHQP